MSFQNPNITPALRAEAPYNRYLPARLYRRAARPTSVVVLLLAFPGVDSVAPADMRPGCVGNALNACVVDSHDDGRAQHSAVSTALLAHHLLLRHRNAHRALLVPWIRGWEQQDGEWTGLQTRCEPSSTYEDESAADASFTVQHDEIEMQAVYSAAGVLDTVYHFSTVSLTGSEFPSSTLLLIGSPPAPRPEAVARLLPPLPGSPMLYILRRRPPSLTLR
ncbi:hypothetical protein DFH06DRAFT_1477243 [Mycena polygramma]|nr:hypothetical protein DFH06DRAFT_1477243 [Mycena polygramma]